MGEFESGFSANSNANAGAPKRGLGRREMLSGAAWSVPVILATTAVPLAAASARCTYQPATRVNASDVNTTTRIPQQLSVAVPAGVKRVRYVVVGGRGGNGNSSLTAQRYVAILEGELPGSLVAGTTLQLIAGSAGFNATGSAAGLGGVGYGNGGTSGGRTVAQSGGGAGSAIVLNGSPLVVAGGSGGHGGAAVSTGVGGPVVYIDAGLNNAGLPGGTAGQGYGQSRQSNTTSGASTVSGGFGGSQTGPGAGGTFGGPRSAFANGNAGSGRNGANGVNNPQDANYGSGGGGGGYYGGGSGGVLFWDGLGTTPAKGAVLLNGSSGGGSSYRVSQATPSSETLGNTNNGQGYVQIEFCV